MSSVAIEKENVEEGKIWQIKYPLLSEHTGVVYYPGDERFIKSLMTQLLQQQLKIQTFEPIELGLHLHVLTQEMSIETEVAECAHAVSRRLGTFTVSLDCLNASVDLFEVFRHLDHLNDERKYPDHI